MSTGSLTHEAQETTTDPWAPDRMALAPSRGDRWSSVAVHRTASPRPKPPADSLGFGRHLADHVFRAEYDPQRGWHDGTIEAYGSMEMGPAAAALHYGQTIFEGNKIIRGADGRPRAFRVHDHARRFASSAAGLGMPPIAPEAMADAILQLARVDESWIPSGRGTSLYIRPLMFASEEFLGVRVAARYRCVVMTSPVASYYAGGQKPVRLWVEHRRVRAAPGGLGQLKTAANYAASLGAGEDAKTRGCDQVLWLDAIERTWLEEAGTMNVAAVIGDELITPTLDQGTILAGVTRSSVLTLCRDWGIRAVQRRISIEEIRDAHARGQLREMFGMGTAAVISPIGTLVSEDGALEINGGATGPLAQRLYETIIGIQNGSLEDVHGWTTEL